MKSKLKETAVIASISGLLFVLVVLGIYDCPLDRFAGIPCPLCGITRAFTSAARGDFPAAFYYHPLWPVILLALVLFFLSRLNVISPSKKMIDAAGYALCVLLVLCFIIRHIKGSPVVHIHFETSLIYRAFHLLF